MSEDRYPIAAGYSSEDTSRESAEAAEPSRPAMWRTIRELYLIRHPEPLACEQVEQILGRTHQTISPRITELHHGHGGLARPYLRIVDRDHITTSRRRARRYGLIDPEVPIMMSGPDGDTEPEDDGEDWQATMQRIADEAARNRDR